MGEDRGETVLSLAYVFFLVVVLPALLIVLVVALAPLLIALTLMIAFVIVFSRVPWTPPEFSLASEAALVALYGLTGERTLLEAARGLADRRRESLKTEVEKELEQALEEGDVRRALRLYLRELMRTFAGRPAHAGSEDGGDR
ncbi:MAG: hypothetical protein ABGY09_00125 [Euryarchaeota archaeon]